ncbi:MAG TPA: hypothetical protein VHW26_11160 [Solirubrobacteraceae bacterium]|nr:hypothetical protein [Solirubrobacteraceae bacterium]
MAVVGLVLGILVLIPLLRAVTPAPPSVFATRPPRSPTPTTRPHSTMSTFRSGSGVVARGVAYSPLSVQRATSLDLPGSAAGVHGHLVIVKLAVRGVSATPSTASVGLVDLVAGATVYRPSLPVASALSHTLWQTLVLKQLAPGTSKRVKLVFELRNAVPARLKLVIGSHSPGAARLAIPVTAGTAAG